MNYSEARNYIDNTGAAGIKPGTEVVKDLLKRLGDPESDLKVIHVAGTNGKGSVCTYLECALLVCGLKVGRYASPSVFRYLERIRLSGEDITEEDYAEAVTAVEAAAREMEFKPTGFEAETAAAFWYFREHKADIVIVECGMGGREDATNVFDKPLAAVFTPISMDHMAFLGPDVKAIALNKAGIMKKGAPAVIAKMPPVGEYRPDEILMEEAVRNGIEYSYAEEDLIPVGFKNPLPGIYQNDNLNTALLVLKTIKKKLCELFPNVTITDDILMSGISKASWPGRYEKINKTPVIIRDGAHNPGAARALKAAIEADRTLPTEKKLHLIMGVFKDKDYKEILRIMLPTAVSFSTIDLPDMNRGLPKEELAKAASDVADELGIIAGSKGQDGLSIGISPDLKSALHVPGCTSDDVFIVFGSLSLMQLFSH